MPEPSLFMNSLKVSFFAKLASVMGFSRRASIARPALPEIKTRAKGSGNRGCGRGIWERYRQRRIAWAIQAQQANEIAVAKRAERLARKNANAAKA